MDWKFLAQQSPVALARERRKPLKQKGKRVAFPFDLDGLTARRRPRVASLARRVRPPLGGKDHRRPAPSVGLTQDPAGSGLSSKRNSRQELIAQSVRESPASGDSGFGLVGNSRRGVGFSPQRIGGS